MSNTHINAEPSTILWDQALAAHRNGLVADVNHEDDYCGYASLVRFDLHDGNWICVGAEDDGGYTYTVYDSDDAFVTTDGGPDLAEFPAELARIIGVSA